MTGSATVQGNSPQGQLPLDQAAKPGRVSADSFRKLTSLLKKPVDAASSAIIVPDLLAPKPVSVQPVVTPFAALAQAPVVAAPIVFPPPYVPEMLHGLEAPAKASIAPLKPADQPPYHDVEPVAAAELAIEPAPIILPPAPPQEIPEDPTPELPPFEPEPEQPPLADPFEPIPADVPPPPMESAPVLPRSEFNSIAPQPFEREFTSIRKRSVAAALEPVAEPEALPPAVFEPPKPRVEAPEIFYTPEQEAESAELARSLLDMMAKGAAAGQPQERALAADTLLRMLPRLPLKSRVMLASRLCLMEQPHHLLVAKLITDPDIAVAGPLLEECAHLTDEDLLRVLAENDPAKRRMMARRRKISRPVTTALIETDDGSVLLTIARNAGAEITTEGFAMMERAASKRGELLAPMCIRADLPVHFAFSLFWFAPPELRRYLLTRFLTDSETLTKILKIARGTHGADVGEKTSNDPQLVKLALAKAAGGDIAQAAQPLAEMSSLAPETITRILQDKQGEPLMALLKTLSFPRSQVQDQVEALQGSLIDPSRNPEDLQSLFDSLSFNKARILLTYWDWSSLGTGPYALLQ